MNSFPVAPAEKPQKIMARRTACPCGASLVKQWEIKQCRCSECRRKYHELHKMRYPWTIARSRAANRCNTKTTNGYQRYGGRGIKCLISTPEVKELWIRDGADKMKRPSLDRIDHDGNYAFDNCRFIEMSLNTSLGNRRVLDEAKAKLVFEMMSDGATNSMIAAKFGCSRQLIYSIRSGRAWAHVQVVGGIK